MLQKWLITFSFLVTFLQLIVLVCPGWLIYTSFQNSTSTKVSVSILYSVKCTEDDNSDARTCANVPFTDSSVLQTIEKTSADPSVTFLIAATDCILGVVSVIILTGDVIANRMYTRTSYCDEKGIASLFLASGVLSMTLLGLFAHASIVLPSPHVVVQPPYMLFIVALQSFLSFLEGGYIFLNWRLNRPTVEYERVPTSQDGIEDTSVTANEVPSTSTANGPNLDLDVHVPRRERNIPC